MWQQKIIELGWEVLPHATYSIDCQPIACFTLSSILCLIFQMNSKYQKILQNIDWIRTKSLFMMDYKIYLKGHRKTLMTK